jgi:DNA topoisomerase-1
MLKEMILKGNYTLIICEKPDAARRICEALADDNFQTLKHKGIPVYGFANSDGKFIVCAALGHLYTTSDHFKGRGIYPVFDIDWFPSHLVSKKRASVKERIESISSLAMRAKEFVNACDFDVEGETIGYNVLKYACHGEELRAQRAKFSSLTKEELLEATKNAKSGLGERMAAAGRTRHLIDFMWGINLSRALSEAYRSINSGYRTISMGRVQGPTLSYVVSREIEIRSFVPMPYWSVNGIFEKEGSRFGAEYTKEQILIEKEAETIKRECQKNEAVISKVEKRIFSQSPPPPFNIGDLQREAYRVFGFSPSQTMQIAERLYLNALISYPRTGSQRIPKSIDLAAIVRKLSDDRKYSEYAKELLSRRLEPHQGTKDDSAHPAIYPTGERQSRPLQVWEAKLFDLVVRRFLSCFGEASVKEGLTVRIMIGSHEFKTGGVTTIKGGWLRYYKPYVDNRDNFLPKLLEGETVRVLEIIAKEKYGACPSRYNQSSLLQKMENEGIGTKATRADIIQTLVDRGYMFGERLTATDLGFSVIEIMQQFSPQIVSEELTKKTEAELEEIERGSKEDKHLIESSIEILSEVIREMMHHEEQIGKQMQLAASATRISQNVLGACPSCVEGKLIVIRSRKTKKRFVGCTNYSKGCRASAPLPQKGLLIRTTKACQKCAWPIVYVRLSRRPWRLCVNPRCPTKSERKFEVSVVPKRN